MTTVNPAMSLKAFNRWVRDVINPQADNTRCNAVSLSDFSKDGMTEYYYPKSFAVNGDLYRWDIGSWPTRGRGMSSHYEIWFHGPAFGGGMKVATGDLTLGKIRKGLRIIYAFYGLGDVSDESGVTET